MNTQQLTTKEQIIYLVHVWLRQNPDITQSMLFGRKSKTPCAKLVLASITVELQGDEGQCIRHIFNTKQSSISAS